MSDSTSDSPDSTDDQPELDVPSTEETLAEGEPELDEWWSWGNFARLFVFPLIIVIVAVVIYGLFQYMIRDQRSVQDYIRVIRTGSENQRWRTAYSLAQEVRRRGREKEFTATSAREIIDLYETAEDPRIRQYLAHVLAEIPLPSTVDALTRGLQSDRPGVKVNAALALGRLRENARSESLREGISQTAPKLVPLLDDESAEVRRMAAFVLGSLENPSVREDLRTTLEDPEPDVRWNGAIALGRLGDDAGESILLNILERATKNEFESMEPRLRRNLITNAAVALRKINSPEARPLLEVLKDDHPDPKVRKAALSAHEELGQ